jgi:ribose transport system ATP-binding protein
MTPSQDQDAGLPSGEVLLGVRALTKSYGGTTVLDAVDVEIRAGEVHALLGENGAGKSTLVKIIAGVIDADSGEVYGAAHDGGDVAMVFQELSVVPEMSVLDNLALAGRSQGVLVPYRRLKARAAEVLTLAGLSGVDLDSPVATLSLAKRQLLEIARGLMVDAKVLILDEPTATLSDIEIDRVHAVILHHASVGGGLHALGPHHDHARRPDRSDRSHDHVRDQRRGLPHARHRPRAR